MLSEAKNDLLLAISTLSRNDTIVGLSVVMVPPLDWAFWVGALAVEWLSLVERCRVASAETVF